MVTRYYNSKRNLLGLPDWGRVSLVFKLDLAKDAQHVAKRTNSSGAATT